MATKLGNKAVGEIVKLKENGVPVEFLVVYQGNPDPAIYDVSCNGTWLLRKDIHSERKWDDGNDNKLEKSDIQSWLNDTYYNLFDPEIKAAIQQVKIPYRKNGGSGGTTQNGTNGLQCKIFLLSGPEVNYVHDYIDKGEGAVLDYFKSCPTSGASSTRVANFEGTAHLLVVPLPAHRQNLRRLGRLPKRRLQLQPRPQHLWGSPRFRTPLFSLGL